MKKVLAFVPLGPPYAGPEVSNAILLKECPYELKIINTSFQKDNSEKGRITLRSIVRWSINILNLLKTVITFRPDFFYYNLSATTLGAIKDSVILLIVRPFVGIISAHMRGGHFGKFYKTSNPFIKMLVRWYLTKCDRVIVQSRGLKEQFLGIVSGRKIYVVPNPAPYEMFWVEPRINDKTILFVGHISKAKGWTDLVKVLPDIFNIFPDLKVITVGTKIKDETNIVWLENEDPDRIFNEYIVSSKYQNRFEFYENVYGNEKLKVFERASVFVLPSYSEGFSMAVLEAMACGLPIITTKVGALPEVVPPENPLISPGNLEELKKSIITLLNDHSLRKKLSLINRKKALEFREDRIRKMFWKVVANPIV